MKIWLNKKKENEKVKGGGEVEKRERETETTRKNWKKEEILEEKEGKKLDLRPSFPFRPSYSPSLHPSPSFSSSCASSYLTLFLLSLLPRLATFVPG